MHATESTRMFLRGLQFFSNMPTAGQQAFIREGSLRHYSKKCNIFMQGEKADRLFVVMNGSVRLYSKTGSRGEAVIALYARGDVFGEAAVFDGGGYPVSAETSEKSCLLEIPGGFIRERAGGDDEALASLMHSLSREMRGLGPLGLQLAVMTAPQRVGSLLFHLSQGMPGRGGIFSFPYETSVAAAHFGMNSGAFSWSLQQLRPLGVAVNGREVRIDSFSRLGSYCNNERPARYG